MMTNAPTINRMLSEISQLGRRATRAFKSLPPDGRRAVAETIGTVTADRLQEKVRQQITGQGMLPTKDTK